MKHLAARIEIQLLMNATARAFGEKAQRVWTHPHADALAAYAACTRDWMKNNKKPADQLQADLYREARRLGDLVRLLAFFPNKEARKQLVFVLYRGIGITMRGDLPGTVEVSECFFSRYYTPEMCALIAAMDDGVVSGIMGGGSLHFMQRITEGCPCCIASLSRRKQHEQ